MLLSFCAGVIWVLWKTSNDHVFDNKIVPTLKQWSLLVRQKEKQQVDEIIVVTSRLTEAEPIYIWQLSSI